MWCAAGYSPEIFWRQTERSFANAIAGAAEREITLAWQVEMFARQKRLEPLSQYLKPLHGSNDAPRLLGALLTLKARGLPMKVERLRLVA